MNVEYDRFRTLWATVSKDSKEAGTFFFFVQLDISGRLTFVRGIDHKHSPHYNISLSLQFSNRGKNFAKNISRAYLDGIAKASAKIC